MENTLKALSYKAFQSLIFQISYRTAALKNADNFMEYSNKSLKKSKNDKFFKNIFSRAEKIFIYGKFFTYFLWISHTSVAHLVTDLNFIFPYCMEKISNGYLFEDKEDIHIFHKRPMENILY